MCVGLVDQSKRLSLQVSSCLPENRHRGINRPMMKSSLFASLLGLALVAGGATACSGGDSGDGGGGGGDLVDGGSGGGSGDGGGGGGGGGADAGGGVVTCSTVADFADLGVIDGQIFGNAADDYLSIDSTLDATAPVDLFVVELFGGFAPFADGIVPGTYEITGDQTDYNTCGACAVVYADLDEAAGPGMIYTAQSGTIVVTSVEGNFTGSFTPTAGTTSFVGYSFNETTEDFDRQETCTVTGGGSSWDKAIPEPTPGQ